MADKHLYKVVSRGLGEHYVLAKNPQDAYQTLLDAWTSTKYGFTDDRKLVSVHLIAEGGHFHNSEPRVRVSAY